MMETPIKELPSFENCINPIKQNHSLYSYCDKLFQYDFFQRNQCKVDMCKICCVAYDSNGYDLKKKLVNVSDELFKRCQLECIKSKKKLNIF